MRTASPHRTLLLAAILGNGVILGIACTDAAPSASSTLEPPPAATPPVEPTPPVDSETIVLRWTREGGVAGFCDGLLLSAGHLASLGTCEQPGGAFPAGELMPDPAIREFERWRGAFASFEVEWADDEAVADGMTIRLSFAGRGTEDADEDTRRLIAEFAARLFAEFIAAQPRAQAG